MVLRVMWEFLTIVVTLWMYEPTSNFFVSWIVKNVEVNVFQHLNLNTHEHKLTFYQTTITTFESVCYLNKIACSKLEHILLTWMIGIRLQIYQTFLSQRYVDNGSNINRKQFQCKFYKHLLLLDTEWKFTNFDWYRNVYRFTEKCTVISRCTLFTLVEGDCLTTSSPNNFFFFFFFFFWDHIRTERLNFMLNQPVF